MANDQQLRDQLTKLLQSGQAFTPASKLLEGITVAEAGQKIEKLPYTLWQLLEHLRIALQDILEFSRDATHESPEWPDGYWPNEEAPANEQALKETLEAIEDGVATMVALVQDPKNDLFAPFPHGDGQNLLREAMLVAEHNAYHLGQVVLIRRLLGTWE